MSHDADLLAAAKRVLEILHGKGFPGWGVAKDILGEAIAKAESSKSFETYVDERRETAGRCMSPKEEPSP